MAYDRLNLMDRHRDMVERILREHVPGVEVWAYGSRVNGRCHDGSDLDLVLRSPAQTPIDPVQLKALAQAFGDSNIPFLVDAHDWARLPASFHQEIQRNHAVLLPLKDGAPD